MEISSKNQQNCTQLLYKSEETLSNNNIQLDKNKIIVQSLQELIDHLQFIFNHDTTDDVEIIQHLFRAYKSNAIDWRKFAKFDRYRYTRNLVDKGNNKYNLMIICWGEGHGSAIHDHANSHCFMKILYGSLEEVRFDWPKGGNLVETKRTKLHTNDVCYINDTLGLHRMENTSNVNTAISLHLYCPPYERCSVFNQNTGQRSTAVATFYSIFGKRTNGQDEEKPEDN